MTLHGERPQLVFISWAENCSRSDSIAKRLGGKSFLIYSPFWGSRYSTIAFKYLSQSIKTLRVLFREHPRTVFVMTPPVIACVPVWIYCKLTGSRYAVDAHTGAFVDKRWQPTLFLHAFFSRQAGVTLVTGEYLADIVRSWRANAKIIRDVPVCFAEPHRRTLNRPVNMVFVSTFTVDEPLSAFLAAAKQVPEVQFYVTGRLKDADANLVKTAPANVIFTDFLKDAEYVGLMLASDAAICLTTADHTMQRGAYEAIYLSKPVITSGFKVLREAFPKGAVHVSNRPEDIAGGIRQMKANLARYRHEAAELRVEKLNRWLEVAEDLNGLFKLKQEITAAVEFAGVSEE